MGCFNVACSISNISINCGTRIAFIPLEKVKYQNGPKGNISMIYTNCIYCPVTLPIFGEYDDYGGIEDIVRCKNVEVIEKKFGMDIQKFCDIDTMPYESGMFIHGEIYDLMVNKLVGEFGKVDKGKYGDPTIEKQLAWLKEWKHNLNLPSFEEFLKMISEVKSMTNSEEKKESKITELWDEQEEVSESDAMFYNSHCTDAGPFREWVSFPDLYASQVKVGNLFQELAEFIMFVRGMASVNTFFFPAANGYQHGNPYMSRRLYRKAAQLMAKECKEQSKW